MDLTHLFKIRKIHNHRCLVTAKSQVDEIGYLCKTVAFCCGLELYLFIGRKSVKTFCQVVQLIQIDLLACQDIQNRPIAFNTFHHAVWGKFASYMEHFQHPRNVSVLILWDGEGNRYHPVFHMVLIGQNCLKHLRCPLSLIHYER